MNPNFEAFGHLFGQGASFAWATVVRTKGSIPGKIGFRMFLSDDDRAMGTVGGGSLELKMSAYLEEALVSGKSFLKEMVLSDTPGNEIFSLCGGTVLMSVDAALAGSRRYGDLRTVHEEALSVLRRFEPCVLVAARPGGEGEPEYFLVLATREVGFPSEALRDRARAVLREKKSFLDEEGGWAFYEYLSPPPHLLLIGGGHVSLEAARLADQLGYKYTVLDDRPEFADARRFPNAVEAFGGGPEEFWKTRSPERFSHVIGLGYNGPVDVGGMAPALKAGHPFVAQIGSLTKKAKLRPLFEAAGVDAAGIERIITPVGMGIKAETPAEIAVSILGAVIDSIR